MQWVSISIFQSSVSRFLYNTIQILADFSSNSEILSGENEVKEGCKEEIKEEIKEMFKEESKEIFKEHDKEDVKEEVKDSKTSKEPYVKNEGVQNYQ